MQDEIQGHAEATPRPRAHDEVAPEVLALVVEGWRRMTPADKVAQVRHLIVTARRFTLAGIRRRHPHASERELRLRLASYWLDRETMVRYLDWDPEVEGLG